MKSSDSVEEIELGIYTPNFAFYQPPAIDMARLPEGDGERGILVMVLVNFDILEID